MDEIQLASLFVRYAELNKQLSEVQFQIQQAVLEIGESRKMAGVTATYYKPSAETPDYESAVSGKLPDGFDLTPYSKTTTSVSWKSVCEVLGIVPDPGAEKPARVVIKV